MVNQIEKLYHCGIEYLMGGGAAAVLTGDGAPDFVPNQIGDTYIDTTNRKIYKAVGTNDVSDWEKITKGAPMYVDFLLVGGGGSGGCGQTYQGGGGGGGGGVVYCENVLLTPGSYCVIVGEGGVCGCNGGNTIFNNIEALGGGSGGIRGDGVYNGADGGNGGGGVGGRNAGGCGLCGGYNGGCSNNCAGGGGGGGGGAGGYCQVGNYGGDGGPYYVNCITGENYYYSAGGGGGTRGTMGAYYRGGAYCGGGCGGYYSDNSDNSKHASNYGGGGGGAGGACYGSGPGNGYQGVFIIRYNASCGGFIGGNCCYECDGMCIHIFTQNGMLMSN